MIRSTPADDTVPWPAGQNGTTGAPSRRTALGLMAAALAVPPLGKPGAVAADPGGLHLVDGWVLTSGDLAGLARNDPR